MKILSFFFPQKIAEAYSPINGKIEIVEQFGKKSIKVQGLEQSGPMVEKIWEEGIKKIRNLKFEIRNGLILGLGGGSAVKLINKHFPQARILGIEIDPVMIKLGKKYLGLDETRNLKIVVADVFDWLPEADDANHQTQFDLILVDLYLGRKRSEKMITEDFLRKVKSLLSQKGTVIFNFLKRKNKKLEFQKILDKLGKVYDDIKVVKPVVNYLVVCR